jgi:hypothetical protein
MNNFKGDISILPVGMIYYGKSLIYTNISGSGLLKKTSNTLPTSYTSTITNNDNDYVDFSLESNATTQPRQYIIFDFNPKFNFNEHPELNTININCNLTGSYYVDNDPTKYNYFYELQLMYSENTLSKRNENYSNTQPNVINKFYTLNVNIDQNKNLNFSIINNTNTIVTWHLKIRFT